ncbi:MAG: DUF503 domain-containing protein [Thermoanaerobaculia bacterium]
MIIGVAVAELHIPHARSLKEKRRVIKSVLDRVAHRYQISAAEVEHQELHQRSRLGFALVNSSRRHAASMLDEIHRIVEGRAEAFVTHWQADLIEDFQ